MTLLLIAPLGAEGEVFVTYDKPHGRLARQQRSMVEGRAQRSSREIAPPGLKNVIAVERGYLALTDSGLFFDITPDGNLRFGGLTEQLVQGSNSMVVGALQPVVVAISGVEFRPPWIDHVTTDMLVCAPGTWTIGCCSLTWATAKKCGCWVLLQTIRPPGCLIFLRARLSVSVLSIRDRLNTAFGQGTRLLSRGIVRPDAGMGALDLYRRDRWRAAGLRATTLDGMEVDLQHNEPVRITGVDSQWVTALEGPLSEGLAALANEHRCADFLSVKDPVSLQWYVVRSGRLIRIPKAAITAQYTLVGTRDQTNVMLHEREDDLLHIYPQNSTVGPLDYVQRNAEVLIVEGPKTAQRPSPVDCR